MRFADYVQQYPDDTAYDIARRIVTDEPEMAIPVLAERVEHARRSAVRTLEHGLMTQLLKGRTLPALDRTTVDLRAQVRAFLDSPIKLAPDGTSTTWGAATVPELLQRKEMLLNQIKDLKRTIGTVDAAIARITAAGATCLNDIADGLALEGLVA